MTPLRSLDSRRNKRGKLLGYVRRLGLPSVLVGCGNFLVGCAGEPALRGMADVDALSALEFREDLRIGSLEDPDLGFSSIGAVAVDHEQQVYVLERQAPEIRVYDPNGTLLRRIGRSGSGPGEFRSPWRIGLIGDTLWVVDRTARRITLFTRSGDVLGTITPAMATVEPLPGVIVQFGAGELRSDGTIKSTWMVPAPREPVADSFFIPFVRLDSIGTILDTISLQPFAFSTFPRVPIGGRELTAPIGPSVDPLYVAAPNGAYLVERPVADNDRNGVFTVTRVLGSRDTLFHRRFRYTPQSFSSAFIDNLAQQTAASWARSLESEADALLASARRAIELPPFQPPISAGELGSDGVLWLRREDNATDTLQWLLISPEGDLLQTVRLPRSVTLHWMEGRSVWASIRDDFAVPWLVRYTSASG